MRIMQGEALMKQRMDESNEVVGASAREADYLHECDEEMAEIESVEELCKRLVRSRRDPEFTPM